MTSTGADGSPADTLPADTPSTFIDPDRGPAPRTGPPTTSRPVHASATHTITSGEWPAQAADQIVKTVDTVRDKTTGPLQTAARGVVYGILAGILALALIVMVLLGAIRGIDSFVGIFMDPPRIWVTYLALGVLFTVAGLVVFRRRRRDET